MRKCWQKVWTELWQNEEELCTRKRMCFEEVREELWGKSFVQMKAETWGREGGFVRKWSGWELWEKVFEEEREELEESEGGAVRKCAKKCAEVKGELWGSGGVIKKEGLRWNKGLNWKVHESRWIFKFFLSPTSICLPTEDSVSTLLHVELDVCKEIHWGSQISASCLISLFLYILPAVWKQPKHSCNKWIRNMSSIYLLSQKHYSKKCLNDSL